MIQLLSVFKEFLSLLNSSRVRYILLGGYAVGFHGNPRATGDLDIWVAVDPRNLDALRSALVRFGFPDSSLPQSLFPDGATILRLGVVPSRIEILTNPSGVQFEACYKRAIDAELDGVAVKIIAKKDLLANKSAAGRLKDLADIEALSGPARAASKNQAKSAVKRRKRK